MPRLLLLTASELTRDPRARRQVAAAHAQGYEVVGISGRTSGEPPAPLDGTTVVRVGRRRSPDPERESGPREPTASAALRELRGLYRLARLTSRTLRLALAAMRAGPADVVHANDFDTLAAGWLAARRWRARLVYDAHELYSEFDVQPPRLYRRALLALETRLARRAAVVTVSDSLARELELRLGLPQRPAVVLNAPPLAAAPAARRRAATLRVVYQGSFGTGRPLGELLDAVAMVDNLTLTVRAVRVAPAVIAAAVADRALEGRVEIAPQLPPNEAVAGLAGQDVGLVFDRPVTLNGELTLPNKVFEYLMAGLAIVVPRLPELARLVDEEGVGLTFEPGDRRALAATLERLADDPALLVELQRRAREAAVVRYNAEAQFERLAAVWAGAQ